MVQVTHPGKWYSLGRFKKLIAEVEKYWVGPHFHSRLSTSPACCWELLVPFYARRCFSFKAHLSLCLSLFLSLSLLIVNVSWFFCWSKLESTPAQAVFVGRYSEVHTSVSLRRVHASQSPRPAAWGVLCNWASILFVGKEGVSDRNLWMSPGC